MNPDARRQTATITKMEAQKRNPKRVSIYLDGSFVLGMDYGLVQQLGLRQGQTLTRGELEAITLAEEKHRAKSFALDFLGYRARSVSEVRERLLRRGHAEDVIQQVIDELRESGLLDDEEFASRWARGRMATKPLGARLLRQELRLKGVSEEIVEKTIEETFREAPQEQLARDLLRERQKRYRGLDPARAKRRMTDFLLRRGFSQEAALEAVNEAMREWETG